MEFRKNLSDLLSIVAIATITFLLLATIIN